MQTISGLLLSLLMGFAGLSKMASLTAFRQSLRLFGVPHKLVASVSLIVPSTELLLSLGLLIGGLRKISARVASILLVVFTMVLAKSKLSGENVPCNCFGGFSESSTGYKDIARNAGLLGLSLYVSGGEAVHKRTWRVRQWRSVVAVKVFVGFVVFLQTCSIFWLLSRVQSRRPNRPGPEFQNDLAGLPIGSEVPNVMVTSYDGITHHLRSLIGRNGLKIAFIDVGCVPCLTLLPDLGRASNHCDSLVIIGVNNPKWFATVDEHGLQNAFAQAGFEVAEAFRLPRMPALVEVDKDGRISHATLTRTVPVQEYLGNLREGEKP